MDEKPNEILGQIESQKEKLGRNLNELESRVKRTTDWRAQIDRNPMLMLGVALGGGILLGSMTGGSKKSSVSRPWSSSPRSGYSGSTAGATSAGYASSESYSGRERNRKTTDTLEHMKTALIAFATAKAKEFMGEALPGFNQHLEEAQQKGGQQSGQHSGQSTQDSGQQPSNPSTMRTDYSSQTAYPQEPVGTNIGSAI